MNKHFKKIWVLVLFVPLLAGCSAMGIRRDETHSKQIFNRSYDQTWTQLVEVISSRNETMSKTNKDQGLILTGYDDMSISELRRIAKMPPVHFSSGFVGAWLYARKKVDYTVDAVLPTATQVKGTLYLQGYNASGKRWVTIPPNGTREKELFTELEQALSSG